MALQTSISELRHEVYLDHTYRYHAKLPIIFMASAALNFATLKPDNLPASDAALDVYIIRGQDVILSQFFHNDTALNWQFERFVTDFKNRFNQDIVVSKQDYNQILVLKNSQFSFVDFNHPNMFLCKNSTHLSQIALLFSQIIEQENAFLIQLKSFQSMLHNAEILFYFIQETEMYTVCIHL